MFLLPSRADPEMKSEIPVAFLGHFFDFVSKGVQM